MSNREQLPVLQTRDAESSKQEWVAWACKMEAERDNLKAKLDWFESELAKADEWKAQCRMLEAKVAELQARVIPAETRVVELEHRLLELGATI